MSAKRRAAALICLTLGLSLTVVISWTVFGGRIAATGPLLALELFGPAIYGSQVLLAAAVGASASLLLRDISIGALALLLFGAWVGELIALTLLGNVIVANEIDPEIAWFYWLLATGGPLQPAAACVGSVAASAVTRRAHRA
jgi:hypothetical protein